MNAAWEERVEALMTRLERMVATWLDEFEKRPVTTSIKVLLVFWVLRAIWRAAR